MSHRISADQQKELISWAEGIIGVTFRDDAKAIGHFRGDSLLAVVVYDTFSQCDCNIHIASNGSKRWLTRTFLAELFHYPFIQLGLRRLTGIVPYKNKSALKLDCHIGFTIEGCCRHALPDDDVMILGMLKEDCIYINQGAPDNV